MKIGGNYFSFDICSSGLSLQRRRMELIAQNIANSETTNTASGLPYQRQFLRITQKDIPFGTALKTETGMLKLNTTSNNHISSAGVEVNSGSTEVSNGLKSETLLDDSPGEMVYIPSHPDANDNGYVNMPNVNIITEMVEMISATRNYEANLTALNSAKQMAKDTLEI